MLKVINAHKPPRLVLKMLPYLGAATAAKGRVAVKFGAAVGTESGFDGRRRGRVALADVSLRLYSNFPAGWRFAGRFLYQIPYPHPNGKYNDKGDNSRNKAHVYCPFRIFLFKTNVMIVPGRG